MRDVQAKIVDSELIFSVTQLELDSAAAQAEFDSQLETVRNAVTSQGSQLSQYHQQLPTSIRQQVEARREKLLADRQAVAGLRYPIRPRPDATHATTTLSRRQPLRPTKPKLRPGGTTPFVSEPFLTDDDFVKIVQIVSSMTKVMERSPSAFVRAAEEVIRDHILVQLNGHFEGNAMGEVFNTTGKTDILVRENDRNLFIGECKFWESKKSLDEAINQLLSYLTWRDAKALLVIFNRTTQMSTVLKTVESEIPNHSSYVRGMERVDETSFVCTLKRNDDADREIQLRVLVMDVPSTNPTKRSREQSAESPKKVTATKTRKQAGIESIVDDSIDSGMQY